MATKRKPTKPDPWEYETLLVIDKRIDVSEAEGIRDRWEFGRHMLAARCGKKRLPNGYLAELVKRTGKSQSELSYRVRFAEMFPTEAELSNALESFTSWHELVESLYASDNPVLARMKAERASLDAAVKTLSNQPPRIERDAREFGLWIRYQRSLVAIGAECGMSVEEIANTTGLSVEMIEDLED